MSDAALHSATRWLSTGVLAAVLAFGLLILAFTAWAAYAGVASALILAAAGLRLARALAEMPEAERIRYPYHVRQRGRRLAWISLFAALGLAAFAAWGDVAGLSIAIGPRLAILAAAAGILGPPMALMVVVWTADGISLRTRLEEPGDPLVAAAASLALALALALLAAVTQWSISFSLLVAFGGLLPSLFVLWSLIRIGDSIQATRPVG